MEELTKQEQNFVKEVAITDNKTQAVVKAYKVKDPDYAGVKGHRLIRKDKIKKAVAEVKKTIADQIPDEDLIKKHKELLEQKQLAYFVFRRSIKDEEIEGHMEANGLDLIVIRETDKGKMAFYSISDAQAVKSGLDMAYKIKGTYAPDKNINLNVDFNEGLTDEEVKALKDLVAKEWKR